MPLTPWPRSFHLFGMVRAAFVVDLLVSIIVSMVSRPKPESELVGPVWSLTPRHTLRG